MFGTGFPVALQRNTVSSDSFTVLSDGFKVKLGGSAVEKERHPYRRLIHDLACIIDHH